MAPVEMLWAKAVLHLASCHDIFGMPLHAFPPLPALTLMTISSTKTLFDLKPSLQKTKLLLDMELLLRRGRAKTYLHLFPVLQSNLVSQHGIVQTAATNTCPRLSVVLRLILNNAWFVANGHVLLPDLSPMCADDPKQITDVSNHATMPNHFQLATCLYFLPLLSNLRRWNNH